MIGVVVAAAGCAGDLDTTQQPARDSGPRPVQDIGGVSDAGRDAGPLPDVPGLVDTVPGELDVALPDTTTPPPPPPDTGVGLPCPDI